MNFLKKICILLVVSGLYLNLSAQEHGHTDGEHSHQTEATHQSDSHSANSHSSHGAESGPCADHGTSEFDPGATAIHHISDANAIHIFGDTYLHLPCILYAPGEGFKTMSSSAFQAHHHGNGTVAIDRFVLNHGEVNRIADPSFPMGEQAVECFYTKHITNDKGKEVEVGCVMAGGKEYLLEKKSRFDGGLMGGGITSFYDFSITRNVFTMILVCIFLFVMMRGVAKSYARREGQAPTGLQNFIEPIIMFIRDEVAQPLIGHTYEKYLPYLLTVFFFILGLNLFGQIPFFPGSGNVTGSLSVTLILAVVTFLITNLNGNAHYWGHTLWMPGVPTVLKILIITPVEILGLFLKPFTLMLRLFANVTAGHIVILSFVSIIFIFGKAGESLPGTVTGVAISVPLTLFMMALELLVAFLQAFIFTMLSAVYIGTAVEEGHH